MMTNHTIFNNTAFLTKNDVHFRTWICVGVDVPRTIANHFDPRDLVNLGFAD